MDDRRPWNMLLLELTEDTEVTTYPGGVGGPVTYRVANRAEVLPGERGIRITCFRGRTLEPPMTLHTDPAGFAAHLRDMVEDAVDVFDGRAGDDLGTAFSLFQVHLEETVGTRRPGEDDMRPAPGGMDAYETATDQRAQRRQT